MVTHQSTFARIDRLIGMESRQTLAYPKWLAILILAAAAFIAYFPSLNGRFILDDDALLTQNKMVQSSDGLYRLWFTTESIDYWPATYSSFWIEWRLWGMKPWGYHFTNLLLHIASCVILWRILRLLSIPGAFFAALLFAVHPVNVQSVAWITQRKNTLAMVFFLISILEFLNAESETTNRKAHFQYSASLLSFLLAMLSKGSIAILPAILLLIAWWKRNRITKSDCLRIAPFFLIAVPLTLLNIWLEHRDSQAIRNVAVPERSPTLELHSGSICRRASCRSSCRSYIPSLWPIPLYLFVGCPRSHSPPWARS